MRQSSWIGPAMSMRNFWWHGNPIEKVQGWCGFSRYDTGQWFELQWIKVQEYVAKESMVSCSSIFVGMFISVLID